MDKRDTLLIVDDMEVNRVILRSVFEEEYNLLEAENGDQAMVLISEYHSRIAVVLLDLVMPLKNGYQVMEDLERRQLLTEFPVIVITAEDSAENEVKAFDLGASDIIMKPFEPHVVKRRVQNMVELNLRKLYQQELIEDQAAKLRESNSVMVDALSSIIEYRSMETGQHIKRIRLFTQILLEDVSRCYPEYGLDGEKISSIVSASSLHDIGKIAIPDAILQKPGRLTPEEFEIMKTHSIKGCNMLVNLDRFTDREYLTYAYNICRYHHERWDGNGYPDGLKGDSIPICAQVVSIADCYDALTNDRVYKKALPTEQAFIMILNGECGSFNPKLLESLKNVRSALEQLSREYVDGNVPRLEPPALEPFSPHNSDTLDTLQLGQMKYFTLLRYMEATVVEVDLGSGLYHVVYLSNRDFEPLRMGSSFEESIRSFVDTCVHPDDRNAALALIHTELPQFFQDGLMKLSRRYRVFNQTGGSYQWCQADVLRVDVSHPSHRRILLLWHPLSGEDHAQSVPHPKAYPDGADDALLSQLLGSVRTCLNDQWFTLLHMNSGLKTMLGYTEQDLIDQFQGRYLNLIYPDDREMVFQQATQQLNSGRSLELEYRLMAKDGRTVWVLDKSQRITAADGSEQLFGVVLDITRSQLAKEQKSLTLERYQTVLEQTNDIVFEWDIQADRLSYSDNWEKKFGYVPISDQASTRLSQFSHLHPEDLPRFFTLLHSITSGETYGEIEFRVADAKGYYRWCKARVAAQTDRSGRPVKAVGVLMDIDKDKRLSQYLKSEAERDGLTRLYNKSSGRSLVECCLEQTPTGETAALLIVDLDNFKQINDTYGHLFGDVVLQELSHQLRRLFRPQDIIARIGGDEFMILIQNVPSEDIVKAKAIHVLVASRNLFPENHTECTPTCSIGIALFPRDGADYETLFQHGDLALYRAKAQGKDNFCVFDRQSMDHHFGMPAPSNMVSTRIESPDAVEKTMSGLVEQTFHTLYNTEDLAQAIPAILKMLGEQFNVSRVYLYQLDERSGALTKSFEWRNRDIASYEDTPPHGAPDTMTLWQDYRKLFNENGVFYCPDILHLPKTFHDLMAQRGTISVLQCEIRGKHSMWGLIGFDDCKVRRFWTAEQISALTFISQLLSTFLLKQNIQESALEATHGIHPLLDHQNAFVYAVDPETFRLRMVNEKMRRMLSQAKEGVHCYQALFQRSQPCPNCPALTGRDPSGAPVEIYNSALNIWLSVSSCMVRWEKRDTYLLTCMDITAYKTDPKDPPVIPLTSASTD